MWFTVWCGLCINFSQIVLKIAGVTYTADLYQMDWRTVQLTDCLWPCVWLCRLQTLLRLRGQWGRPQGSWSNSWIQSVLTRTLWTLSPTHWHLLVAHWRLMLWRSWMPWLSLKVCTSSVIISSVIISFYLFNKTAQIQWQTLVQMKLKREWQGW